MKPFITPEEYARWLPGVSSVTTGIADKIDEISAQIKRLEIEREAMRSDLRKRIRRLWSFEEISEARNDVMHCATEDRK